MVILEFEGVNNVWRSQRKFDRLLFLYEQARLVICTV
jgi:hypothetical protein